MRVYFDPAFRERPRLAWFPGTLADVVAVRPPETPTRELLLEVHAETLVERVEASRHRELALLSAGAVLAGTRDVAQAGGQAVALPGVGGHHAGRAFYGGMCLFNDVAIALADLRRWHPWRVAVLDTDAHHADGSIDVLGPDTGTLYGCVCIEGFAPPYPETFDVRVGLGLDSDAYLETALGAFAPRVRRFCPELIIWYFGFDLLDGEYASLGFQSDLLRRLATGLVSLADEVAGGRLLAVLGGGKEPRRAEEALAAVISGLASPGSLPGLPGVERTEAPTREPTKEWVEMTFGPLGAGKQEVTVGSASVTPRRALEQLGLGYEDIDAIDLVPVEKGERWALRYFDPEDRRIVVMEFGSDFSIVSETRVHVKEWMRADYYGFSWPAGCPWSLE